MFSSEFHVRPAHSITGIFGARSIIKNRLLNQQSQPSPPCSLVHNWWRMKKSGKRQLYQGNCLTLLNPGLNHAHQAHIMFWKIGQQSRGLIIYGPGVTQQRPRGIFLRHTTIISQDGTRVGRVQAYLYLDLLPFQCYFAPQPYLPLPQITVDPPTIIKKIKRKLLNLLNIVWSHMNKPWRSLEITHTIPKPLVYDELFRFLINCNFTLCLTQSAKQDSQPVINQYLKSWFARLA